MTCWKIRRLLPGYLDGAAPSGAESRNHALVREHIEFCSDCRLELDRYRKLAQLMSRVERAASPADLAVSIRVAAAREREDRGWVLRWRKWTDRAQIFLENFLEPLALPTTGGVVAAMTVFAIVYGFILGGVPVSAVPNDLPTNLIQPARLESLAPFPVPLLDENAVGTSGPHGLVVEATVNAQGEVVDYQILSGPTDLAVRRQLDQVLLFSRFRPQMSFGRPTPGGRVVLSFSEVHVKG